MVDTPTFEIYFLATFKYTIRVTNYSHCAVIIRPPELTHPMTWKFVPFGQHLICAPSSHSGIQIEYRGRRQWHPTPVFLHGESQGRGSLVGCSPWGRTESDTTEATEQQQQQQRVWMVCFCSTVFEASARKTQRWGWWWWLQLSETRIIWISLHSLIHLLSGIRCWVGFLGGTSGKEPTCQCKRHKRRRFDSWVGKIPWRRAWQPTLVFLSGDSHAQKNLVGYSP